MTAKSDKNKDQKTSGQKPEKNKPEENTRGPVLAKEEPNPPGQQGGPAQDTEATKAADKDRSPTSASKQANPADKKKAAAADAEVARQTHGASQGQSAEEKKKITEEELHRLHPPHLEGAVNTPSAERRAQEEFRRTHGPAPAAG